MSEYSFSDSLLKKCDKTMTKLYKFRVIKLLCAIVLFVGIWFLVVYLIKLYKSCFNSLNNTNEFNNASDNQAIKCDRRGYKMRGELEIDDVPNISSGMETVEHFSGFTAQSEVNINIVDENTVTATFNYAIKDSIPDKFVAILAKYINQNGVLTKIGDAQFTISNEASSSDKMCTMIDNVMRCQHTFSGINPRDNQGNPYIFKHGIAAIFGNDMTAITTPSNLGVGNPFFVMTKSADSIQTLINDAANQSSTGNSDASLLTAANGKSVSALGNGMGNGMANANGEFEMLKAQLGGYPDNLIMDAQMADANKLSDLVNKSFANGAITINLTSNV